MLKRAVDVDLLLEFRILEFELNDVPMNTINIELG